MHLPYPKRPPFFALRVMNAMMDTEATKTMGRDACLLVAFIATYEDRLRYSKPVQFRCSHLLQMLNFSDWRKLNNVRAEAVAAGWLNYVAPAKGFDKPGTYFVTLPDEVNGRLSTEFAGSDVDTYAYSDVDTHVDSSVDSYVDTHVDSSVYLSSPVPSTQTLTQIPNPKPNTKKTKAAKPPSFDALDFVLPEEINTPEMQEAWTIWVQHRNEIKKRLTPTSCQQQAAQFVEWGVDRSIAAIRHTVSKGWQGLREDEETTKTSRKKDQLDNLLGRLDAPKSSQPTPEPQRQPPPQQRQKTQAELELERYKALQDAKLRNPSAYAVSPRPVAAAPPPPEEPPKPKEPKPIPSEQDIELRRKNIVRQTIGAED